MYSSINDEKPKLTICSCGCNVANMKQHLTSHKHKILNEKYKLRPIAISTEEDKDIIIKSKFVLAFLNKEKIIQIPTPLKQNEKIIQRPTQLIYKDAVKPYIYFDDDDDEGFLTKLKNRISYEVDETRP